MTDGTRVTPDREAGLDSGGAEEHAGPATLNGGTSPATAATSGTVDQASLWSDAWAELRRNPLFIVAGALIVAIVLMAIAPQLFTRANPYDCDLGANFLGRPSAQHWFGFDIQGCDYYTRVVYGARSSIAIGLITVVGSATIAAIAGTMAGYYGGAVDALLARLTDITFAIPQILGGIVLLNSLPRKGIFEVSLALILLGWPVMFRLMRSAVLSTSQADYVDAARALGASDLRIIRRHILPNAIAPVLVYATINVGIVISAEAALTFLGVGLQTPAISWGLQLSNAQDRLLEAPHLLLFPGLFLSLTIFAFILMGDALRDAFDPKLR